MVKEAFAQITKGDGNADSQKAGSAHASIHSGGSGIGSQNDTQRGWVIPRAHPAPAVFPTGD